MYMSNTKVKLIAKENLQFQWGASLLTLILFAAISACGNIIPVLGALLILGPMSYGLNYVYIKASNKEKIDYWDLFKGFENDFGENFLAGLLVKLYTFLWSLLFIIPGIIKGYSYAMTMYLLVKEPELNAFDAVKKSREYMDGNKMRLFCLDLSFLGWDILTLLTAGILGIYVAPYKRHAKTVFFNDVYEKKNMAETASYTYTTEEPKVNPMFIDDAKVVDVDSKSVEEGKSEDI